MKHGAPVARDVRESRVRCVLIMSKSNKSKSSASKKRRADGSSADKKKRAKITEMVELEPYEEDEIYKKYACGEELGRGAFGVVYEGKIKSNGEKVAIKKIKMLNYKDGIHPTALREIKFLREFALNPHPNIIQLHDVYQHRRRLYLVFEFCLTDLECIVKDKMAELPPADVKSYLQMLLQGVAHCHSNWVLHRDLKPNNLMIGSDHRLKLIDFGLAKVYASPKRSYAHAVVTMWYRAPELLFGSRKYGPGLDMWSIGCIFAELLLRKPLFPGNSELDQLGKIFRLLGTPTEENWPGMRSLPSYVAYESSKGVPMRNIFIKASDVAIDLLQRMLVYDPLSRISAKDALKHAYFREKPVATIPSKLVAVGQLLSSAGRSSGDGDKEDDARTTRGASKSDAGVSSISKQLTFG